MSESLLSGALEAVLSNPDSDEQREHFAAACESIGDPARARFVRLQLAASALARHDRTLPTPLFDEERALKRQHGREWAGALADREPELHFFRGFTERVVMRPSEFVARAEELFAIAPIRRLIAHGPVIPPELFDSPHFGRLVYLALEGCQTDDAGLACLAASPHARKLKWLDLGSSPITMDGLEALAASPNLPELRYLDLGRTPLRHFAEDVGRDWDGTVVDVRGSRAAAELEAKYGRKRWLHPYEDNPGFVRESAL